jgi:hypothetical protein
MDTNFTYTFSNGVEEKLPFRTGDLVQIISSGGIYPAYISAFVHFTGSTAIPYYCESKNNFALPTTRLFKVMGIAEHNIWNQLVCYLIDNEKRGVVIEGASVKPFKVYPLREGENEKIKLEKIETYEAD